MTGAGAIIVIAAVLIGLIAAAINSLDGIQTALSVALAWMVISTIYHVALAFVPRGRRR